MIKLMLGDCLEKLKELPDNSVDSIVTDPPYGLSFMGKSWDYDVPAQNIWVECLRVLKPGGHLLSFFGTRTYHRGVCRIEDAGFTIKDQIQWIYGQGFPKSHNLKGEWQGWGCALKPANEPIVVAQKPISEDTIAANVLKWGTGALNIDGSRIETSEQLSSGRHVTGDQQGPSGYKTTNRTEYVQSPQGRWPANVILDEEASRLLDEQSGITKSGSRKPSHNKSGNGWKNSCKQTLNEFTGDQGGASRFFYVAKASKKERNAGLEGIVSEKQGARPNSKDATGKFPDHDHRPSGGNFHPTVKPLKLNTYLINLVTPPGGVVLDPFMGSGSTGVAAKSLGFGFIGIEREPQYFEIAQNRIESADEIAEETMSAGQMEFGEI